MVQMSEVKIRAKVIFGGTTIETPYIRSFSVNRARGQLSATFSASLRVPAGTSIDGISSEVVISAGRDSPTNTIFTGYVHNITISPSREDSSFVIVDISGQDAMHRLQGQRYTRRISAIALSRFGAITAVTEENERYKERFPAKIYDGQDRLLSHQVLNAEGQVITTPPASFPQVGDSALSIGTRLSVKNLGPRA